MNDKRIRYVTTIFTLDRIHQSIGITIWDNEDLSDIIKAEEKHYGLKMISSKEELLIEIEYTNIIWKYRIYYGSYKKKYKPLIKDDERWEMIDNQLARDLKMIGLDALKDKALLSLKNNEYFEYKNKIDKQFKRYCV